VSDELKGRYLEIPRRSQTNYQAVSNSEAMTYLHCEKKHYFQFALGLQSRNHPDPLQHGKLGHQVLHHYYKTRKAGSGHQDAVGAAMDVYHNDQTTPTLVKMANMTKLLQYFDHYKDDDFKVLLVEEPVQITLANSIYPFTADLVIEYPSGAIVLWDHKIVEKFWNDNRPKYEPQLYKYVFALREKGYNVTQAKYNFIKTVDAKDGEQFKRVPIKLNNTKIKNMMRDHEDAAERIIQRRRIPVAQYKNQSIRNLSYACDRCQFKLLCELELEGRDISRTMALEFEPNDDYGYQPATPA